MHFGDRFCFCCGRTGEENTLTAWRKSQLSQGLKSLKQKIWVVFFFKYFRIHPKKSCDIVKTDNHLTVGAMKNKPRCINWVSPSSLAKRRLFVMKTQFVELPNYPALDKGRQITPKLLVSNSSLWRKVSFPVSGSVSIIEGSGLENLGEALSWLWKDTHKIFSVSDSKLIFSQMDIFRILRPIPTNPFAWKMFWLL